MRLSELTLDAYGPFAGLKLHFDAAARLHIVHGANEAGKSSALAAIGDLLYGVPSRAEKNFLRPADLRLGAAVAARNGQTLQFFRRRGVKAALLDATGAALSDDCLTPFLGAASREIFERAFGLDAEALRKGGDDMLRAEGEIGASLFAAASGLRGLIDLRRGLEEEADGVFGERKAGHRTFYQALDRFDAARKAEKEATLTETALKNLRREIEAAEDALKEMKARDHADKVEEFRLKRLVRAAPILKNLARARESIAAFDDLAGFAPEWAERLEGLLAQHGAATEAAARAAANCETAREECERIVLDEALLARGEDIEALNRDGGAMAQALDHLPRREKAHREVSEKLRLRAFACGLDDAAALRAAQPDTAFLARAETLVARGRELRAQIAEPQTALASEETELKALRAQQDESLPDANALAEKLAAFGFVEKDEESRADLALACAEEARKLEERRARLKPELADLEAFAAAPSPDATTIELAARELEGVTARETETGRARHEAMARADAAESAVRALEQAGAHMTRAQVTQLRAQRDALWPDLEGARGDAASWSSEKAKFVAAEKAADAGADSLFENAARVVEGEAARAERDAARKALDLAEQAASQAKAQGEAFSDRWAYAWRGCAIVPATPRAMTRWRAEADALLALRESQKAQSARLAALTEKLIRALPGLEQIAREAGLAPLPLDPAALVRRIRARIGEIAQAQDRARTLAARIAAAPERIAGLKQRLAELGERENLWRAEYEAALAGLRLAPDAAFDEAQARIALWRDLPVALQEEAGESHRISAIRNDLAAFEQKLDALLDACGRDIPARPAVEAARALHARLGKARDAATASALAHKALAKAEAASASAQQEAAGAEQRLAAFCAEAGFAGEAAPLSERLRQRRVQLEAIDAQAKDLALATEGADEADLAHEAENFDAMAARARLDEIARERESREALREKTLLAQHDAKKSLQRCDDSAGAEQAAFDREAAKSDISAEARRWAVLKLASLMVSAGLEKHRRNRQDPLLARAGAIYSGLTGGRYDGLAQDFAEDEKLHLLARRHDGATLKMCELSEGARDQLYLALRLAFLEDYARKSEAPPFIGDDLFASFDERRVAAGLRALANLSPALQPILFTHHAHVVDIAKAELGDAVQALRLDLA